ncbi:DUF3791 domain-containing protein [Salipaludibacillus sp. CF4.18]|uniref:DUF3791 domain-containing protein n=1 Tax=Salipaludibacillus sp. CF4.18 TaxID=3373081 RepID=UPI003EE60D9B
MKKISDLDVMNLWHDCTEILREDIGGASINSFNILNQVGFYEFLERNYRSLHTESDGYLLEEIGIYLEVRGRNIEDIKNDKFS